MKTLIAFCLLATVAIASDYVVYVQSTGEIVSYDKQYDIDQRRMTEDKHGFYGLVTGTNILGILVTTNAPAGLTNIVELTDKTVLDPATYIYSIKITPEWTMFTNSIVTANELTDGYLPLNSNLTASLATIPNSATKTNLLNLRALILQVHNETKAVHNEVKDLKKVVGRNIMLTEP